VPRFGIAIRSAPATRSSRPATAGPYPCFDGIRACAALAIVAFHAYVFSTVRFHTTGGRFLAHLNVGVWVFFVTSGFLLYLPFARAHAGTQPDPAIGRYALRRAARIYPAYWVALAFWLFVLPRTDLGGTASPLSYVTLTQTYFEPSLLHGIPVAWTLVTEVSFYAFLPLYALGIGALAARARSPLAIELAGIGILIGAGVVAVCATASGPVPAWVTVLPVRLHVFALGMLLAVVAAHPWSPRGRVRLTWIGRSAGVWWLLAAVAYAAIPLVVRVSLDDPLSRAQTIGLDVCRTLVGFCIVVPAVLGPQDHGAVRAGLRARPIVFLGVVSYGVYLWHYFVLTTVQREWLHARPGSHNTLLLVLVSLPIVVAAATASFVFIERPAQLFAARLRSRRAAPTPRLDAAVVPEPPI